ncbi:MAG: ABC transporter ATP-binding protein [Micropepsaceae bacterium]
MSGLVASGIAVTRGARRVLAGVSASFAPGSFTVVIGPNGAGKSTLMAVLAGLLKPDAGSVSLDGQPLARISQKALARARAYLPQSPRAEWPISVERLVALGLTPQLPFFGDVAPDEAAKVKRALEACDLIALKDQAATTLSGGELARAMLARAIVGDPALLLVDEPTAGLDPRHALDAMVRLKARAAAGKSVIAAVHDLTLALSHADRVIALRDGQILADVAAVDVDAALLKALYDVDARIVRDEAGVSVRYL